MSSPGGRRPSYHYVRRDPDPAEWRALAATAVGVAVGVGAVVLYLGRQLVGRDRVGGGPPAVPRPPGPRTGDLPPPPRSERGGERGR